MTRWTKMGEKFERAFAPGVRAEVYLIPGKQPENGWCAAIRHPGGIRLSGGHLTAYYAKEKARQLARALIVECDQCDGCGWTEGGEAIQSECRTCQGHGAVALPPGRSAA